MEFPNKKYNIIYADPPWNFKTYSLKGKEKKSAECHYQTMNIEDIYNLPIGDIADENCILFLWATNPMLPQALETITRWGFTYKTVGFSWYKKNKIADSWFWGCGYHTRANCELCLLATKGTIKRIAKNVHQVIDEKDDLFDCLDTQQIVSRIEEHSKKPAIVREKIVQLCGDLPRIELFARQRVDGWDCWGDEV